MVSVYEYTQRIAKAATNMTRFDTIVNGDKDTQVSIDGGVLVRTLRGIMEYGKPGAKGDPGANVMSIGLFTDGASISVPTGTNIVRTAGYSVNGRGVADYVYDSTVDAAYVTAHPRAAFRTTNGRGFRFSGNVADPYMFGAVGDGTANDTSAVQAAYDHLASTITGGRLLIPYGKFKCNLTCNSRNVSIMGYNPQTSVLAPYDSTKPTVVLTLNDGSTLYPSITDVGFLNLGFNPAATNPDTTIGGIGLQFGSTAYVLYTEYTGRVNVDRCRFEGFDKAVNRPWGNIMVKFDDCEMRNNNYHFFSVGKTTSGSGNGDVMHPGCLTIRGGVWTGGRKACFYMKGNVAGSGQVKVSSVVADTNKSYIFYIDSFTSTDGQPGFVIEDCWNEQDADLYTPTGYTTTVEGDGPSAPVWGVFKNCQGLRIVDTPLGSLKLTNTTIVTRNCSLDRLSSLVKDVQSALFHDDARVFGGRVNFGIVRSLTEPNQQNVGPTGEWFRRPLAVIPTRAYAAYAKLAADGNSPINFTGQANFATTTVAGGGVVAGSTGTQSLSLTATSLVTPVNVAANKYIVWLYTYRKLSGPDFGLQITGGGGLSLQFTANATDWETVVGMAYTTAAYSGMSFYHYYGGSTTVVNIGGLSLLEFPTLELALKFINSGHLALA